VLRLKRIRLAIYGVGVGKTMKEYFEDVENKASAKVKKAK